MLKPGMYISDRYEIIDKVGSGGMADVYKAKCHRLNRFVAIKVLKTEYSDDKNFVKKFRGEAQSAAGLSHPNIVNVYDVGDDNGLHYIVMELVEGITLKNFIERKGKLEVKEAVGISIQIAMGMEAAHLNHIIHRDIKPQNIIISREGKVKVTDFGIAKATTSNTITSNAMGSVHYLSPEQARGGYSDEKSDIYSLGVTLYEMLTGQVPFAGDNTVSVALLHIQGEAIPLREINPSIPYSIEKIVQKCMQKKPERRYLSSSDLMNDLRRSITNPNGDFVVISSGIVTDSPTITISQDEVNTINKAAYATSMNQGVRRAGNNISSNRGTQSNIGKTTSFDTNDVNEELYGTDGKRKAVTAMVDDEDDLDSTDPRMEKIIFILTIVAGVVLTVIVLFFVSKFFNLFGNKGDGNNNQIVVEGTITPTPPIAVEEFKVVEIPRVIGLKLTDAEKQLYSISETFRITYKEEFSDEFEQDMVIDQYPAKGAEIPSNGEIELTISSGSEPIEIPDVYNRTEEQAIEKLLAAGFKYEIVREFNAELEKGRVIKTNPERLTLGVKDQIISLYISDGSEGTTMPSLLYKTREEAMIIIESLGLTLNVENEQFSSTFAQGTVMYQSIQEGIVIQDGASIDLTISLGEEDTVPTPTPTQAPTIAPTQTPTVQPSEPDEDETYTSSIVIYDNPFDYSGEKGIIIIELEQDGVTRNIMKTEKSYESFPLSVTDITSESGSKGTIRMYVGEYVEVGTEGAVSENGQLVKYTQYPTSWAINFDKVEN